MKYLSQCFGHHRYSVGVSSILDEVSTITTCFLILFCHKLCLALTLLIFAVLLLSLIK